MGNKIRVLVADDNPDIVQTLSAYAQKRGFEALVAENGEKALQLAQSEKPDAILLDVDMPGLDGRDVMQKLKDMGVAQNAVVIFVTGRDAQSDRLVGLELGAADYETKPLNYGMLFNKVERLVTKKRKGEL